jgi:hypothetical protein
MPTLAEKLGEYAPEGRPDECWEWTRGCTEGGYGQICNSGKILYAHRVAFELEYGPIPKGLYVCHGCDNPKCTNPSHLAIGTQLDNMRAAASRGRTFKGLEKSKRMAEVCRRGESHRSTKLTEFDVRYIRCMYAVGVATKRELMREYNMSRGGIDNIINRYNWKHLAPNTGEWKRAC